MWGKRKLKPRNMKSEGRGLKKKNINLTSKIAVQRKGGIKSSS